MSDEELFKEFFEKYLRNIEKILPMSYRAQQLKNGGNERELVFYYETQFLKQPFLEALKKKVLK